MVPGKAIQEINHLILEVVSEFIKFYFKIMEISHLIWCDDVTFGYFLCPGSIILKLFKWQRLSRTRSFFESDPLPSDTSR